MAGRVKRERPTSAKVSLDAVTSADSMRSSQTQAATHDQLPPVVEVFAPVLAMTALTVLCCLGLSFTHPPSCPAFPRTGLCCPAFPRSVWTGPLRYYAGSDSRRARTRPSGLSASFALPSEHPIPNHVVCLDVAFTVTSAHRDRPDVAQA